MPDYGKIIFNDQAPVKDFAHYFKGKVFIETDTDKDRNSNDVDILSEGDRIKFDRLLKLLHKMLKYSPTERIKVKDLISELN
jgi:hypothetical protein